MKLPCTVGLAPMAGYTDYAFRRIAYEHGACFAYTEMISSESVLRKFDIARSYLPRSDEPFTGIQIYGNDPLRIAEASKKVQDHGKWIDLNAGCPVKKIIKRGMGGALLRDLELLSDIVKSLKDAVSIPVSVKTRIGWERVEVERIYEKLVEAGADLIVFHARTVKQGFKGRASWKVLSSISGGDVPILVSGDVFSPESALKALESSGADGVVVARGAVGNPWIFDQVRELMESGSYSKPGFEERLEVFKRHLEYEVSLKGERGVVELRKFVAGYTSSLPHAREFRTRFMKVKGLKEALDLIEEYEKFLRSNLSQKA